MPPIYPFTAVVGQERMKRALVLNAVAPRIGGVLIRGERGTAKSTAARALAALLPDVQVVVECRFSCDPERPTTWCTECRERVAHEDPLPVMKQHESALVEIFLTKDGKALPQSNRCHPVFLMRCSTPLKRLKELSPGQLL